MDADQISQLDDEQYEQLVISNTYPPARNEEAWAALTHRTNLDRTRKIIDTAWQRTGHAIRTRKEEREAFQSECHARGDEGRREWYQTRPEYEQWRRRAVNFHQTAQRALSEVKKIQKDINRATNHSLAQEQRESLRKLAVGVRRHQAQHARAGGIAEQPDYELWRLLDLITVPHGPNEEPVTLSTMLDIYWMDVDPVTEIEQRRVQAEKTMRAAPDGQSGRHAGVPRARHVHNDKKLA